MLPKRLARGGATLAVAVRERLTWGERWREDGIGGEKMTMNGISYVIFGYL